MLALALVQPKASYLGNWKLKGLLGSWIVTNKPEDVLRADAFIPLPYTGFSSLVDNRAGEALSKDATDKIIKDLADKIEAFLQDHNPYPEAVTLSLGGSRCYCYGVLSRHNWSVDAATGDQLAPTAPEAPHQIELGWSTSSFKEGAPWSELKRLLKDKVINRVPAYSHPAYVRNIYVDGYHPEPGYVVVCSGNQIECDRSGRKSGKQLRSLELGMATLALAEQTFINSLDETFEALGAAIDETESDLHLGRSVNGWQARQLGYRNGKDNLLAFALAYRALAELKPEAAITAGARMLALQRIVQRAREQIGRRTAGGQLLRALEDCETFVRRAKLLAAARKQRDAQEMDIMQDLGKRPKQRPRCWMYRKLERERRINKRLNDEED